MNGAVSDVVRLKVSGTLYIVLFIVELGLVTGIVSACCKV